MSRLFKKRAGTVKWKATLGAFGTARQILADKRQCCQNLNFSGTAVITLVELPRTMQRLESLRATVDGNVKQELEQGCPAYAYSQHGSWPEAPSCFAPGSSGGGTCHPANTGCKGL